MKPIKKKVMIEIEITPSDKWKKTRHPDTEKLQRKSFSTIIAKAMITEIEGRIRSYASEQMDEPDIVGEVCNNACVDNYDDESYSSLVDGLKIDGIDQFPVSTDK
jgi:hypothetical protein